MSFSINKLQALIQYTQEPNNNQNIIHKRSLWQDLFFEQYFAIFQYSFPMLTASHFKTLCNVVVPATHLAKREIPIVLFNPPLKGIILSTEQDCQNNRAGNCSTEHQDLKNTLGFLAYLVVIFIFIFLPSVVSNMSFITFVVIFITSHL